MSSRGAVLWVIVFAALAIAGSGLLGANGSSGPNDSDSFQGEFGGQDAEQNGADRHAGDRGRRSGGKDRVAGDTVTAVVSRVVDGDTIVAELAGGKTEKVRYIGVDTPETVKPNRPVECFGKTASAFNHSLVEGRKVKLEFDAEPRDRFGRMLAYVYVNGTLVEDRLLAGGFATTLPIEPNTSKAARFARIQRRARDSGRGLWSQCSRP